MNEDSATFVEVKSRLNEIADEVSRDDITLDDALALYEEAVKLGLEACNLSENDIFPDEIEGVEAEMNETGNADPQGDSQADVQGDTQTDTQVDARVDVQGDLQTGFQGDLQIDAQDDPQDQGAPSF